MVGTGAVRSYSRTSYRIVQLGADYQEGDQLQETTSGYQSLHANYRKDHRKDSYDLGSAN